MKWFPAQKAFSVRGFHSTEFAHTLPNFDTSFFVNYSKYIHVSLVCMKIIKLEPSIFILNVNDNQTTRKYCTECSAVILKITRQSHHTN